MSNKSENFLDEGISDLSENSDAKSNNRYPNSVRRRRMKEDRPARPQKNRNELGSESMGTEFDVKHQSGTRKSEGSDRLSDWEIREVDRFRENRENVRFSSSKYRHEGPSSNYSSSSYDHNDLNGFNREEHLEQDRAELLRKLNELQDQLSRSCNVAENSKEYVPRTRRMVHEDPYTDSRSVSSNGSPMRFFQPDKHNTRPYYNSHYPEPHPFVNKHEMHTHHLYSTMQNSHNIQSYEDQIHYQQQSSHTHYSGLYRDDHLDPFVPYPPNSSLHSFSCSCFHCYEKHQQVHKRFVDVPKHPTSYNHKHSSEYDPQSYNARIENPQMRWQRDVNSDMGGGVLRGNTHRVGPGKIFRHCRPVSGGAPFITCHNCFELLQLPQKVVLRIERSKQKVQCGACSVVLSCAFLDKKLIVSVNVEMEKVVIVDDSNSSEEVDKQILNDPMNQDSANFNSDDFDRSGYDFQSMDKTPLSNSIIKTNEVHSLHSSSSIRSEEDDSQDGGLITRRTVNKIVDLRNNPPPPGSPLQDHFDYSSNNREINQITKENQSNDLNKEKVKVIENKVISRESSIEEVSVVATEMEVSFTGASLDSGDTSREEIRPIINKHVRPDHIVEDGDSNVTINGHPILDRLVKKAEKLAGPIRPGNYWYDSRAGFWGVIGGPCLGIIPPYIEEFNYPMEEDCAGGNTSVFVNGRELHRNDLELLTSRGLPSSRDKSYLIYISGKVIDEDTNEKLKSLGKLAPTIEKAKHGFGMKVPRTVSR